MSPWEIQAFKEARDNLGHASSVGGGKGPPAEGLLVELPLFPGAWGLQKLQVWECPAALQAELTLTLEVLDNITNLALEDILKQPLHMLRHIRSQLWACVTHSALSAPRPHSRLLSQWLQWLKQATKKESPGCLQASVISNLFCLLTWDLRCVARPDQCA
ncbi:interferon lambda-2 [Heterocephalus glaber]|uniref:Interferon lambda-2 n=1 Tax=Heterocephalus glaber TaxID=10181 RepID=A0AAX6RFY4_HETGA|nr:interferon lambda-2 [Heterocephalus glaber]